MTEEHLTLFAKVWLSLLGAGLVVGMFIEPALAVIVGLIIGILLTAFSVVWLMG